jgi:hypothetical protein
MHCNHGVRPVMATEIHAGLQRLREIASESFPLGCALHVLARHRLVGSCEVAVAD